MDIGHFHRTVAVIERLTSSTAHLLTIDLAAQRLSVIGYLPVIFERRPGRRPLVRVTLDPQGAEAATFRTAVKLQAQRCQRFENDESDPALAERVCLLLRSEAERKAACMESQALLMRDIFNGRGGYVVRP